MEPETDTKMQQTRASKRARQATAATAVLAEPTLLQHVLPFAGRKEHLFWGGVSRAWREASQLDAHQRSASTETRLEAAVNSEARLVWAMTCGGLVCRSNVVTAAARCTDGIAALQWMLDNGHLRRDGPGSSGVFGLCWDAASAGQLANLQWARANDFPWNETTCRAAASNGHLHILRYARANGCPWNKLTSHFAASNGHVEMLRWALANGCPHGNGVLVSGAMRGSLEVLQAALDHGCPGSDDLCWIAAQYGKFEVLRWARANGVPWDRRTCQMARRYCEDQSVLEWIHANGCPCEHNQPSPGKEL